jgi:hypothetical protein
MGEKDIISMSPEDLKQYETELEIQLEDVERELEEYTDGKHPTSYYFAACREVELQSKLRDVAGEQLRRLRYYARRFIHENHVDS